jgi:antitoxin component of MazEF toxin-antitoxin module
MDSDLMRYQLKNWRWAENKLTELGERVDVPLKLNDDFGQSLQMIFKENLLKQIKLTVDETVSARLEELLPAAKMEQIQATGSDAYIAHQNTNKMRLEYEVREEIKKRTEPSRPSWADIG